jgi:hypothetical protein
MPKKPWTDFASGKDRRLDWERKADTAKRMAFTGSQVGPLRTKPLLIGGH